MKAKTSDKILLGILTIGVGAIVCLLSPTKKTSAFLIGSSAGLATSLYVINTKNKVEQKSHKQNLKFDSSTTTYQPQLDNQTQEEIADVSNDELSSYSTEKISTWLESKAIEVKDSQTPRAYDRTYDRLTLLLGNDYPHLQKFYLCIKKRLSDGKSFKLDLATKDVKTISKITNFGSKLHEYTFLSHYRYSSTTKAIFATPNRTGSIINFFTGQWFERFIYLKISQFLTQQGLDYQYQ